MIDSQPEVNPNVTVPIPDPVPTRVTETVPNPPPPIAPPPPAGPILRDSTGTVFDPSVHESDNGIPRLTKDGKRYRRKRGNPGNGSTNQSRPNTPPPPTPDPQPAVDYRGLADFACGLFFGTTQQVFGDGWKPASDEYDRIHSATFRYMQSTGMPDLPPSITLILAVGFYAVPRFASDAETHARVRKAAEWVGIVRPKVEEPTEPIRKVVPNESQSQSQSGPVYNPTYVKVAI